MLALVLSLWFHAIPMNQSLLLLKINKAKHQLAALIAGVGGNHRHHVKNWLISGTYCLPSFVLLLM
jgi:hypothetical protein